MEEVVSTVLINNPTTSYSHSTNSVQMSQTLYHQCKICRAPAQHSNYGAMTCCPCKMFFKRNSEVKKRHLTCAYDGHCKIDMNNRHICAACRLAECFANGMQTELIRCPISKKNTSSQKRNMIFESVPAASNILMRTGVQDQLQQLPTLNLSRSDNSTLNSDQWTLLSNLLHIYDESKLISIGQQFMNENNFLKSSNRIDLKLPKEFFAKTYETSEAYLRSNGDLRKLSFDDRSAFLHSAAQSVTCMGGVLSWSRSQLYNHKPFINVCIDLYGQASVTMIEHVLKFIDPDIVIAKLALSLFAFSDNISIFSSNRPMKSFNTLAIFRIQNVYAELTWKYLVYRYDHYQSVRRFINLIECLLAATDTAYDAHSIEKHVNDIELLVERTELALTLDDMERIDEKKN